MIPAVCLLVLLVVATATDVARHRIYNWTTYPGIVAGVVLNLALPGGVGWESSLSGLALCGAIMLLCFVLFNVGGGDVKLITMMGSLLGLERGIEAMLWTFVLGSVMGTALLIWQIGIVHILRKTVHHLGLVLRSGGWVPLTPAEREPLGRWLYLAPAALLAVCIVLANAEYRWW